MKTTDKQASTQEREDAEIIAESSSVAVMDEPDKHSAELKGDKVIVRHDLVRQRLAQSQGSALQLTNRAGVDVRQSMPEWYFVWADERDLPTRLREGFEIVSPKRMPDLVATGQSEFDKNKFPNQIRLNELTLLRLPMAEHLEYVKLHDQSINMVNEGAALNDAADAYLRTETGGIIQGATPDSGGATIQRG